MLLVETPVVAEPKLDGACSCTEKSAAFKEPGSPRMSSGRVFQPDPGDQPAMRGCSSRD